MSNAYGALGAAIADIVNSALDVVGYKGAKDEYLLKKTERGRVIFEKAAISAAFEYLAIDFDASEPVNETTITQAINKTLLSGADFQLNNIFDSAMTRRQVERYALRKINEGLGGELVFKSLKKPDLKRSIKQYANFLVQSELAAGGGEIADLLGDSEDVSKIISRYEKGLDKPLISTPEAENNRERQARYRASHGRHWEPK